ncbi:MAG: DinB family protein [SAR202 cluster bacterium]|nr:DinB family protein [SAR202 cluster bacterium]HAL46229.1 hypothetical protein [Dehalococcoidia bacterium]MDP6664738.1 DinB family protein [SAR202 cluster bacterium]MDP6799744.1 DinB family protein [SAR202 cluster bacterium]MQG57386.1 DinB family protein [SAR202 cluster bacterium]
MARPQIDILARLMERAFAGNEHALLDNLATVREESWNALPMGAKRSIREITLHVGMFKFMYANHGFKGADMDYSDPPANPGPERLATLQAATQWLGEAHSYLTACIAELQDDRELKAPRKAHWGDQVSTYHLIVTMIEHDLYHAGEINRTRALLQDDDGWWVPEG